jgi:hypothetical protein
MNRRELGTATAAAGALGGAGLLAAMCHDAAAQSAGTPQAGPEDGVAIRRLIVETTEGFNRHDARATVSVRLLRPGIALAHVINELSGPIAPDHQRAPPRVKDGGEWRVAAFHNTIVQPFGAPSAAPAATAASR